MYFSKNKLKINPSKPLFEHHIPSEMANREQKSRNYDDHFEPFYYYLKNVGGKLNQKVKEKLFSPFQTKKFQTLFQPEHISENSHFFRQSQYIKV